MTKNHASSRPGETGRGSSVCMCPQRGQLPELGPSDRMCSAPKALSPHLSHRCLALDTLPGRNGRNSSEANPLKSCSLCADSAGCLSNVHAVSFLCNSDFIQMQRQLKIYHLPDFLAAVWPFGTFLADENGHGKTSRRCSSI